MIHRTYTIDENGCHVWTGRIDQWGFGRVPSSESEHTAARTIWEEDHGPVPADMVMGTICRNLACVNPAPEHHAPETRHENKMRWGYGSSPDYEADHSLHGPDEVYIRKTGRRAGLPAYCIPCNRVSQRRHNARRRGDPNAPPKLSSRPAGELKSGAARAYLKHLDEEIARS